MKDTWHSTQVTFICKLKYNMLNIIVYVIVTYVKYNGLNIIIQFSNRYAPNLKVLPVPFCILKDFMSGEGHTRSRRLDSM